MKNIHIIDPTSSNEPHTAAFLSGASIRPRLQRAQTTGYVPLRSRYHNERRRTTFAGTTDTAHFLATSTEMSFAEKAIYTGIGSIAFVSLVYGVLVTLTF